MVLMINRGKLLYRAVAMMLMATVLSQPVIISDAMAQACSFPSGCPATPSSTPVAGCAITGGQVAAGATGAALGSCVPNGPAPSICTVGGTTYAYCAGTWNVPEMSDYLALAFIIVAGGLMLYRRRGISAA